MSEAPGGLPAPSGKTIEGVVASVRSSQGIGAGDPLDGSTSLLERGLALDSVALLELALALEERFGIRVEEHELTNENFETVSAVARLIERKTGISGPIDA